MYYQLPIPSNRQLLRADVLAANRAVAGWLGLDPRFTISSNIARAISRRFGIPFSAAKLAFHAGLAGFVSLLLSTLGAAHVLAVGVGGLLLAWFESFDTSRLRQ